MSMTFFDEAVNFGGYGFPVSKDLLETMRLISNKKFDGRDIAIGEHENLLFTEVRTPEAYSLLVFDKKKGNAKGMRLNPTTRYVDGEFGDNFEDKIAALAAIITHLESIDSELAGNVQEFNKGDKQVTLSEAECYKMHETLQAIQTRILLAIKTSGDPCRAFGKKINEINLSQVETGLLTPSKIIVGRFEGFKSVQPSKQKISIESVGNRYNLDPGRDFTEEERDLIYKIPSWFSLSPSMLSMVEKVKASWDDDPNLRIANVLMEGPKGTGKTMSAKVAASLWGLPYTKQTCFADMDSSNVIGSFLPKPEEEVKVWIPSEEEMFFDPAGCYEKLTGISLSEEEKLEIGEDEVLAAIEDAKSRTNKENKSPEYVYYPSPIVQAFENGWVCEVQEPTCIADAGVLMILNSALENEGVLELPHRTIKRHPDCVFIITTNRDYEGCRPLNQAFRDRANLTKKVDLPSDDELIERLSSLTGCKDEAFLRKTVEAANALNGFLRNNGINDSVSLRGMKDFVAAVLRGFDIRESAMEAMIYKISTDDDEVAEMESFLEVSTRLFE